MSNILSPFVEDARLLLNNHGFSPEVIENICPVYEAPHLTASSLIDAAYVYLSNGSRPHHPITHEITSRLQTSFGRMSAAAMVEPVDKTYAGCALAEDRFMRASMEVSRIDTIFTNGSEPVAFKKAYHERTVLALANISVKDSARGALFIEEGTIFEVGTDQVPKTDRVVIDEAPTVQVVDITDAFPAVRILRASSFTFPSGSLDGSTVRHSSLVPLDERGVQIIQGNLKNALQSRPKI